MLLRYWTYYFTISVILSSTITGMMRAKKTKNQLDSFSHNTLFQISHNKHSTHSNGVSTV